MTKTLRVLHIACLAPPEIGGIGMAALREVEGLRARGYEAVLVAPEMIRGEKGVTRPTEVTVLKPLWRLGNAAGLPLAKLLQESWDVVHLHYPFYGTAEWLLALPRKTPIVVTFHMDGVMGGWREPIAHLHRWMVQPWLLRQAKKIFVSSVDYAEVSSIGRLVRKNDARIVELPFGIDLSTFCPGPSVRERFGLPEDVPVFLMVGGLDRPHLFKGVPVAIRALAMLKDQRALLVIRGDGELKSEFEALAKELGVGERVRFLPPCSKQDLPKLYRSADILLFPSTSGSEAFGLVAIEAQACGTPVIVSNLPGVRSVLNRGKSGWVVPPRDVGALCEQMQVFLEKTPEDILQMRREAVTYVVDRYSQEGHLDRLISVYQNVCVSPS